MWWPVYAFFFNRIISFVVLLLKCLGSFKVAWKVCVAAAHKTLQSYITLSVLF